MQEGLALEGWEFLADFDPALIRRGAAKRWREIAKLPAAHNLEEPSEVPGSQESHSEEPAGETS